MAFTVCNICDEAFRFAKFFTDNLYDFDICLFIMSADIVYFTDTSVVDDQVDRLAVVGNVEPVTDILACSVYRKCLISKLSLIHI